MTSVDAHHRFTITHEPSGDECEADSRDAAILAATTLLADNDNEGSCRIFEGSSVLDVVWAHDDGITHLQGS